MSCWLDVWSSFAYGGDISLNRWGSESPLIALATLATLFLMLLPTTWIEYMSPKNIEELENRQEAQNSVTAWQAEMSKRLRKVTDFMVCRPRLVRMTFLNVCTLGVDAMLRWMQLKDHSQGAGSAKTSGAPLLYHLLMDNCQNPVRVCLHQITALLCKSAQLQPTGQAKGQGKGQARGQIGRTGPIAWPKWSPVCGDWKASRQVEHWPRAKIL